MPIGRGTPIGNVSQAPSGLQGPGRGVGIQNTMNMIPTMGRGMMPGQNMPPRMMTMPPGGMPMMGNMPMGGMIRPPMINPMMTQNMRPPMQNMQQQNYQNPNQ